MKVKLISFQFDNEQKVPDRACGSYGSKTHPIDSGNLRSNHNAIASTQTINVDKEIYIRSENLNIYMFNFR